MHDPGMDPAAQQSFGAESDFAARPAIDIALEPMVTAPHEARSAVRHLIAGADRAVRQLAELATSEVVTHAIMNGAEPYRLRAWHTPTSGWLRVEVDHGPQAPPLGAMGDAAHTDLGAHRLAILAELPGAWGYDHSPFGRTLWFELDGAPDTRN